MKKAVYAASFDPVTHGHLWVIQEAAHWLFDQLVVAIGINPDKDYTFSLEERLDAACFVKPHRSSRKCHGLQLRKSIPGQLRTRY